MLKKYPKKKCISEQLDTCILSYLQCTKCNSKACMSCVKALNNELKINDNRIITMSGTKEFKIVLQIISNHLPSLGITVKFV